ncbi:helix-turn-helix transcriptional regulator [Rhizobium laguerreae]|uniref:helix-turn-helix transcriptional regulator n=1 Tax=Rhizobium laguerreae TaxID=1076926 RepID=UPI00103EC05C|nr:AlpA family phage regulatory protein [Rhizobium laguerreae]TBY07314.1 AlpA family phage regulatory protein [Rhizobium laguerreae]
MASDDDGDDGLFAPREVERLTTLSRMTIWRLRRRGRFPPPVHPSPGRVAYRRRDVRAWFHDLD